MSQPCPSTCSPWATTADVCSPCDDYAMDASLLEDALQIASDVLYALSGERFPGSCSDVVRPNARWRDDGRAPARSFTGGYGEGYGWMGRFGPGLCSCNWGRGDYGCNSVSEITLGGYPVTGIIAVKIDGVVLDTSRYRVDDYRYLVRLADADGTNPGWPCCQDMTKAATEDGTFEVEFSYGQMPPPAGVRAAAVLGCEIALSCQPETAGRCRLPARVTSVTRQGVSQNLVDPQDFLAEGLIGIFECDLFLRSYNPNKLTRRASVISPDTMRRVRRVDT